MQTYRTGVLLIVSAGMIWSLMGLAIRNIVAADTWQILFYRSAGMVPVLFAFVAIRSGGRPFDRLARTGFTGLAGGISLGISFAAAIFALQTTSIANAAFLFAAAPFLSAVLAWATLGETVRPATRVAIAVAAVGVAIMVGQGLFQGAMAGNIAALIAALGFAAFTVTLRWGKQGDMMPAALIGGLISMVAAAAIALLSGGGLAVSLWDGLLAMAMGAMLLATGLVLYTIGSRVVPAAETSLLFTIETLLAPIWVWLFLNETVSIGTLAGGAIVLGAIAVNALCGTGADKP